MPIALAKNEFVQVTVHQLVVDALSQQPVVSLTDPDEKRVLLISIGHAEARAIFLELQGIEHLRPLTHDLLESIIQKVDGKIRKIFITHIKKSVFYATIVIEKNGGLLFDQFHHLGADFRRYYSFQI